MAGRDAGLGVCVARAAERKATWVECGKMSVAATCVDLCYMLFVAEAILEPWSQC